jgi:hypothetical protein
LFVFEWWDGVRPYALRLTVDTSVSLLFLIFTWTFQAAEKLFSVEGFAQKFFDSIHQVGSVASLALFASLSVRDIWRISKGH